MTKPVISLNPQRTRPKDAELRPIHKKTMLESDIAAIFKVHKTTKAPSMRLNEQK
jgi:hypothetical protein